MRGLGGAVLVAWFVAACSGSKTNSGTTGGVGGSEAKSGAGGSAGAAPASTGGSSGGSAGAAPAGTGGSSSSGGSAGATSSQGLPGAHDPDCGADCGGNPVGNWVYTSSSSCNVVPVTVGSPEPEECTFPMLPNSQPGEPPAKLERDPRFDLSGQPLDYADLRINENGTFSLGVIYAGTAHMQLAAPCRKVGDITVACSDLKAIVEPALLGQGVGQNFSCVDNAAGGCDCSYDVTLVGGPAGMWHTTAEGKLLFEPSSQLPGAPAPEPTTYCAKETLALGPELRLLGKYANGEPTVFERVNCTDGVQGPGEEDVDCGQVCPPCR